jgi:23S rRNA (cytidine2498-2'-O)-methyltransferase
MVEIWAAARLPIYGILRAFRLLIPKTMLTNETINAIYLADPRYLTELCEEVGEVTAVVENLVFSPLVKPDIAFALDVWFEPVIVNFDSISQAVKLLRAAGKFWYLYPLENIRRSHLIESELRKLPSLAQEFPVLTAIPPIGCFTLLDKNTLVYSSKRWKKPPLGNFQFIEDKLNPPNRAYLKLWEALSLCDSYPRPGETAMDLGASPGGWTYVMQTFGTKITAVDKAALAPEIGALPNVSFLQQSAFALNPLDFETPIDWLLCDVACYPERTFDLIMQWINSGKAKKLIFTIKLQGKTDLETLEKFKNIQGGRVIHLFYNKHEATFFYPAPA